MLSTPSNAQILEELVGGPLPLTDFRAVGSLPPTTMRAHLRGLANFGVIEKRREPGFPGRVAYELTPAGRNLLQVADPLAAWLASKPARSPGVLGDAQAHRAVKALTEAWTTGIVRPLASRPLSLTELDRVNSTLGYPALERRLSAMRLLGLVETAPNAGRKRPYAVTNWLRGAVAPLMAAARWERLWRHVAASPLTNRDVEALFLLSLPLVRLAGSASGICRLAIRMGAGPRTEVAGAIAVARGGAVTPAGTRLEGSRTDAWVIGSSDAWLAALIDHDSTALDFGGDRGLASELVEGLHGKLFARVEF